MSRGTDRTYTAHPAMADWGLNGTAADTEISQSDQTNLENSLADPANGITARVIISTGDGSATLSAGNYIKVRFFQNNKPLAIYKSRKYDPADIIDFLSEVKAESLNLEKTITGLANVLSPTSIAAAETSQATVTATYADDTTADKTATSTYGTSDAGVATVDAAGLVTGVASGTATITATYNSTPAPATITVT